MAAKGKGKGEDASGKGKGKGVRCRFGSCGCQTFTPDDTDQHCAGCEHHISFHWPQGACAACGATPAIHRWSGMLYCSPACGAWLGDEAAKNLISTRYANKRRWLRNHRAQRERIVQDLERERMARADLEGRLSWA